MKKLLVKKSKKIKNIIFKIKDVNDVEKIRKLKSSSLLIDSNNNLKINYFNINIKLARAIKINSLLLFKYVRISNI